jgi:hypothetical protein
LGRIAFGELKMRFKILLVIVLVLFFGIMLLVQSNMKAQDAEIVSLRRRVHNLELVVQYQELTKTSQRI